MELIVSALDRTYANLLMEAPVVAPILFLILRDRMGTAVSVLTWAYLIISGLFVSNKFFFLGGVIFFGFLYILAIVKLVALLIRNRDRIISFFR